ncbi:kinectin isoform X2 [Rhodamnia argentea]|nr:kinectin isoform X2 [Rhodamnia argentea]
MEEYLQYMKTLRCQMNDVEDQAAKISVEEQMQTTTIQSLESDLTSAKSEIQKLKEETEQMMTAKGQICSQILDKQRKVTSLESDCLTLTQTLELVHQERVSLSGKLVEKSTYYAKVAEDINVKFQQLQGWLNCRIPSSDTEVKETMDEEKVAAVARGKLSNHLLTDNVNNEASKELTFSVDSATAKLDEIKRTKAKLAAENSAMKQRIEQMKSQSNEFQEELRAMDVKTLEREQKALLADIVGETEFLKSLQNQIEKLKGISQLAKCACGQEYKIELDACV